MRGGAEVARKSHALQVEGSIPSPAPRLDPKEGTRPPHPACCSPCLTAHGRQGAGIRGLKAMGVRDSRWLLGCVSLPTARLRPGREALNPGVTGSAIDE